MTANFEKRVYEHRERFVMGFPEKYQAYKLLYLEEYSDISEAISREKQLKHWKREWKLELIRKSNPNFADLYVI